MNALNRSAFRAMFWKECRENGKWAMLAAVGLALMIAITATQSSQAYHYQAKPFYLFWASVDSVVQIGAMLTALMLGMIQILPERRRDQWAFLMHRPASRAALFWGKVCAGLSLYALATAVPLIAVSAWAATAGHVAGPFDPRLMLAGAAAIACGVNVYFGALTVALRPARWYGGRLLPLAAGGALAFFAYSMAVEFWQAMALLSLTTIPLAFAAMSSFAVSDNDGRRSLAGRSGLTVTLYLGALVASVIGIVFVGSLWSALYPPHLLGRDEQYAMLDTGQIVRVSIIQQPGGAHSVREVHDLSGHALTTKEKDCHIPGRISTGFSNRYSLWRTFTSPMRYGYPINVTPRAAMNGNIGFYASASRRVLLYSPDTFRLIGEIGPTGAAAAGHGHAEPFSHDYSTDAMYNSNDEILWVFGPQIYRLTSDNTGGVAPAINQLHIAPFLRSPLGEDVISFLPNQYKTKGYFIATSHRIYLVNSAGALVISVPTSQGEPVDLTAIPGDDGVNRYQFWTHQNAGQGPVVTEYSSSGRVLRRQELPPLPQTNDSSNRGLALYAILAPSAVVALAASHTLGQTDLFLMSAGSIIGCVFAIFCWLAIRRAGLSIRARQIGALAGLLLGLPALMTILSIYGWPTRVACPSCGKNRAVTNDRCDHCGAAFPEPKRDGTEIFETPGLVMTHTEAA